MTKKVIFTVFTSIFVITLLYLYLIGIFDFYMTFNKEERAFIRENQTIQIGVDEGFAPYEFIEDGEYKGMSSEYIKILEQETGINFVVSNPELNWSDTYDLALDSEIKVLPMIGITENRRNLFLFSDPYDKDYLKYQRIVLKNSADQIEYSVSDLEGVVVGVKRNTNHHDYVLTLDEDVEIILFDSNIEALESLNSGFVDIYVGNYATAMYLINSSVSPFFLKVSEVIPIDKGLGFAMDKEYTTLQSIVNKVFEDIENSQKEAIYNKWVLHNGEGDIDSFTSSRETLYLLGYLSLIVLILSILIIHLNRNRFIREKRMKEELKKISQIDELTKLFNRRAFNQYLNVYYKKAKRTGELAFIFLDIDDFKHVNDTFGHDVGDEVLVVLADIVMSKTRSSDVFARWGGEEFVIITPEKNPKNIAYFAERLRKTVADTTFPHNEPLTISLGISILSEGSDIETLIKQADIALYNAKNSGKNRFEFYTDDFVKEDNAE